MSVESWNGLVTKSRGEYLARLKSAHLTNASGSSSSDKGTTQLIGQHKSQFQLSGPQDPINPSTDGKNLAQGVSPTAAQAEKPQGPNSKQKGLANQVKAAKKNWPTPILGDSHLTSSPEAAAARLAEGKATLSRVCAAENWPTMTASDYRTPPTNSGIKGQKVMPSSEHALHTKVGGKLNPNWVEQLMGVAAEWTQLPTEWTG